MKLKTRKISSPIAHVPVITVKPTKGWATINLAELWQYRDLLYILALRDVKLRYKQTILGIIWVILQPLLAALIFAAIFGRLANLPSDGLPYLLFAYTSLVGWNYFAGALERAGTSLVDQAKLITKVYFPRILIPLASTLGVLVDLAVSLVVMGGMLIFYQIAPTWRLVTLPLFLLLITVVAAGMSFWVSALGVYYRDFIFAMPFLVQIWLYLSPVVYSSSLLPLEWRWLYAFNPMVAGIEGLRWAILGQSSLSWEMLAASTASATLIFISSFFFFRRVERSFADVI